MTIEERAYNAFCGTTSCRQDNKIYRFCKNCQHDSRKDAYIKGATEQRKIDIDKACDLVYDQIVALIGYTEEAKNIAYKYFRKAMEEEQ